jgi:hypothetical protein
MVPGVVLAQKGLGDDSARGGMREWGSAESGHSDRRDDVGGFRLW